MTDNVTTNMDRVNAKLGKMGQAMRGQALETAVLAGLAPIQNRAKVTVHRISSTLSRSIHSEAKSNGATAVGRTGTNVDYAQSEEFLGAGGHAYMRPSFDAERETAVEETAAALADIVEHSIK